MRSLPIKWRLSLQFSLAMTVILFLSGTAIWILYIENIQRNVDTLLFVQFENIRSGISDVESGKEAVNFQDETFSKINAVKGVGLAVVILDPQGGVVEQSSGNAMTKIPTHDGYSNTTIGSDAFRAFRGKAGSYTIIVSQNVNVYEHAKDSLLVVLLLVFSTAVFCSFGISAYFAGRAVAPLRILKGKVQGIDPAHMTGSPLMSAYPDDEIGRLAGEFDLLLTRLKDAIERERQFTQDASHELRTPLMVIKSSLELLSQKAQKMTHAQQEKMIMMQSAVRRMHMLVDDLLFLSRGIPRKAREKIPIAHVIVDLLSQFKPMAEEKGLTLLLDQQADPYLLTTKLALEKVIGNLLKNAIHFTKKGGITVILGNKSLSVGDTGIGIPKAHLTRIFDRFYRAGDSRVHAKDGFGLGLAICKAICEQEGWRIEVESEQGKGSTFTVFFLRESV
jgi:signal transduction histidine kinase